MTTTDPKDSLAETIRALALDMSSLVAGTGLAHRTAGLIRGLADHMSRASSQSCRAVTAPRPEFRPVRARIVDDEAVVDAQVCPARRR
ncbi:hypothetical protein GCM10010464_00060 [Pseudonocardia yunnanensis]